MRVTGRQAAPDGAHMCYGVLSYYKQVAPPELISNTFFKRLKCYKIFRNAESGKILGNIAFSPVFLPSCF